MPHSIIDFVNFGWGNGLMSEGAMPLPQPMSIYHYCSQQSLSQEMGNITAMWIQYIDSLVQERHNSSALAMELCLSCTKPSICCIKESMLLTEIIFNPKYCLKLQLFFMILYRVLFFLSGQYHGTTARTVAVALRSRGDSPWILTSSYLTAASMSTTS